MIAFKAIILLNYLLVSCKRPDFYRILATLPSALTGPCFVDSSPEGPETTKRFLNYVDFINEKSKFFRQLGYNLDSGPRDDLLAIVENSPEHLIQEINHIVLCMDTLFKQDISFNVYLNNTTILGNIALVKDLVRIYQRLIKRTTNIEENKDLYPPDAVAKLGEYWNRIDQMTEKLNGIYQQALDMNIQSVVRLIDSTRECHKSSIKTNSLDETNKYSSTTHSMYPNDKSVQSRENQNYTPDPFMPNNLHQQTFELEKTQTNSVKESSLLDFGDIFESKPKPKENDLNDLFLGNSTQESYALQQNKTFGIHDGLPPNYPQPSPRMLNNTMFEDDIFGIQNQNSLFNNQNVVSTTYEQTPKNTPINQPVTTQQDPFDINAMIQRNLDFASNNNNTFNPNQPAVSNIVPAQGMTGVYNSYYSSFQQSQTPQFQMYNQNAQIPPPGMQPPTMGNQFNPYSLNNTFLPPQGHR